MNYFIKKRKIFHSFSFELSFKIYSMTMHSTLSFTVSIQADRGIIQFASEYLRQTLGILGS